MTVLIINEKQPKSILVSLDKRSLVWEKLHRNEPESQNNKQFVKTVLIGDIVIRMQEL